MCISPNKSDFVTYHPSRMNIKDLSSTNTVAGEGQIAWTILDVLGHEHHIQLPGYHISQAQVRLLSPQVLLRHFGGHAHLTSQLLQIRLDDGSVFDAPYCPRTSLPCLQVAPTNGNTCFWSTTFDFTQSQAMTYPSLLTNDNTNLSAAQKELLLWIQSLLRDRKWHHDDTTSTSLHSGSILPCRTRSPPSNISDLKCIACVCAKAHRRSTKSTKAYQYDPKCSPTNKMRLHLSRPLPFPNPRTPVPHLRPREARIYLWHSFRRSR